VSKHTTLKLAFGELLYGLEMQAANKFFLAFFMKRHFLLKFWENALFGCLPPVEAVFFVTFHLFFE